MGTALVKTPSTMIRREEQGTVQAETLMNSTYEMSDNHTIMDVNNGVANEMYSQIVIQIGNTNPLMSSYYHSDMHKNMYDVQGNVEINSNRYGLLLLCIIGRR